MRIILISAATFPSDQGIRTISAILKKAGHDVKIVFMAYSEDYSKFYHNRELNQLVNICKNADLIGVNCYVSTMPRAIQITGFLKKKLKKEIPIVWGGIHPTLFPQDCIKYADIVCVGDGEDAVLDLAKAIENKKPIDKIQNLWVKDKNGEIVKNPVRPFIDILDTLPFVDYDIEDHYILENHNLRKFKEEDLNGQIFFLTGRGCPYGCTYCSNNLLNELYKGKCKSIVRWHSVDYIIEHVLYLKKRFKTLSYFDIRDDTFSLRPLSQIQEFCEKYKEKVNMRFKCLGDPKTISEDKIKVLVDAGCTDIIIGIQGNEKTNRDIYKRGQTNEQVLKAGKILSKYKNKLAVMYDVITCNPFEDAKDVIDLIRLLQILPKPYYVSVNNLVFFPGTGIYERAKMNPKLKKIVEESSKLNYWDRNKHILLKRKDMYLVLILNLMRGSVTENRFGLMPNKLINYLLKPSRIKYNLNNPALTYIGLSFVSVMDLTRERIAKPLYRSTPVNFKVWYDKIRYRV